MKRTLFLTSAFLPLMVAANPLTRDQSHSLVDGVRESTRSLLSACVASEDFTKCAMDSGIRCSNLAEKAARDYLCVTRATIGFAIDGSTAPTLSTTWEVNFRVFFARERWNIGPERIGRVAE